MTITMYFGERKYPFYVQFQTIDLGIFQLREKYWQSREKWVVHLSRQSTDASDGLARNLTSF